MIDQPRIDHLVVAAADLEQGSRWCEQTLGVPPGPGGEHPLMGTHNRLLRIATVDQPRTYFEVIARNPAAAPEGGRRRWFDLDDEQLQASLREQGPRLVHWVVQVPDVRAAVAALARRGIDRGEVLQASRMTPRGLLQWQITVRADGQRLFDGCLPTLIQWGDTHPAAGLPESGVSFRSVALWHPKADELRQALGAIGVQGVEVTRGEPNLCASLLTPRGLVRLDSRGR